MTAIGQFRGDSGFSTWLYRLVVNTCTDGIRRRNARPVILERSALEAAARTSSHEESLARAQTATSVQSAVSSLPPKFRIAILLRYFAGLSYEEMAKALDCSPGTVASRLSRGHRILAEKLRPLRQWLVVEQNDVL